MTVYFSYDGRSTTVCISPSLFLCTQDGNDFHHYQYHENLILPLPEGGNVDKDANILLPVPEYGLDSILPDRQPQD